MKEKLHGGIPTEYEMEKARNQTRAETQRISPLDYCVTLLGLRSVFLSWLFIRVCF
jgi:hypothetical protein